MMVYHRDKYGAFKVSSILHCPKTMKNPKTLVWAMDKLGILCNRALGVLLRTPIEMVGTSSWTDMRGFYSNMMPKFQKSGSG